MSSALVEHGGVHGRATDIALESADVVILRPDCGVPGRSNSRKYFQIIRQNLFWHFFTILSYCRLLLQAAPSDCAAGAMPSVP